jgi:hypothetical protein
MRQVFKALSSYRQKPMIRLGLHFVTVALKFAGCKFQPISDAGKMAQRPEGRELSQDNVRHYQQVVEVLQETILLMDGIDELT